MLSNEDPDYRKALEYSLRFCGYRERSKKEVLDKLISKNYEKELIQKVINRLEDLGAIDNLRFAKAFARGKNRSNRWGKIKIRQYLFHKGLNEIEINRDSSPEHLARDIQHPGIRTNRVFGERLAEEFAAQYNFKK